MRQFRAIRRFLIAIGIGGVAGLAGCDRTEPAGPGDAGVAAIVASAEPAIEVVTRALALALRDEGIRQRVKDDMRVAPVKEHKLNFKAYLKGNGGNAMRSRIASLVDQENGGFAAQLAKLPDLEMYFPVPEHRQTWLGGEDLIVAAQLDEDTPPVGYTLTGERVVLSLETPPITSTIVLVPVETDFSKAIEGTGTVGRNTSPDIGTMGVCNPDVIDCGGGGGGGDPPPPPVYPTGIYFDRIQVFDDGEAWPRGEAELEVHIEGTQKGIWLPTQFTHTSYR